MKILLINTNPVVSRLLALCTRDEYMVLDEVKSIEAVEKSGYDIVFVDEGVYDEHSSSLFEGLEIRKKVFISYLEDPRRGFDITVKKPFLPSRIIKILSETERTDAQEDTEEADLVEQMVIERDDIESLLSVSIETVEESVKEVLHGEDEIEEHAVEEQEETGARVLNMDDIAKIKALLDMDDDEEIGEDALLDEDAYEERKIKVIKEQLMADGLEILEEDEIVEELSASVEKSSEKLQKKLEKTKKRHEKNTLLSEEVQLDLEEALHAAIANLKPKKIKKLLNGEEIKVKIKLEDHS